MVATIWLLFIPKSNRDRACYSFGGQSASSLRDWTRLFLSVSVGREALRFDLEDGIFGKP